MIELTDEKLKKLSTQRLYKMLQIYRPRYCNEDWYSTVDVEVDDTIYSHIKAELNTREHLTRKEKTDDTYKSNVIPVKKLKKLLENRTKRRRLFHNWDHNQTFQIVLKELSKREFPNKQEFMSKYETSVEN